MSAHPASPLAGAVEKPQWSGPEGCPERGVDPDWWGAGDARGPGAGFGRRRRGPRSGAGLSTCALHAADNPVMSPTEGRCAPTYRPPDRATPEQTSNTAGPAEPNRSRRAGAGFGTASRSTETRAEGRTGSSDEHDGTH